MKKSILLLIILALGLLNGCDYTSKSKYTIVKTIESYNSDSVRYIILDEETWLSHKQICIIEPKGKFNVGDTIQFTKK